jgi:hypothetical protein
MKLWSKSATTLALFGLMILPTSAGANDSNKNFSKAQNKDSAKSIVKVLSDHPGSATALTSKQKSEIKQVLAKGKGNRSFVCTGTSLAGQRESMYPVVLLRAQLVCDYAKSINPSVKTTVKEKTITATNLNGRVEVISK